MTERSVRTATLLLKCGDKKTKREAASNMFWRWMKTTMKKCSKCALRIRWWFYASICIDAFWRAAKDKVN